MRPISFLSMFAAVCLIILFGGANAAAYSGGAGTLADPYQLGAPEDWHTLAATSEDWDKHFVLVSDINLADTLPTPIGNDATAFTGTVDGAGHVLYNILIDLPAADHVGVFGIVGPGGAVSNLGVENINVTGLSMVGGLVGMNYGTITGCSAQGLVAGLGNVGGLVGSTSGDLIASHARAWVTADSSVTGGLAGYVYKSAVTTCYFFGRINAQGVTGGLVGYNDRGTVGDCYARGKVKGDYTVGGLVGYNYQGVIGNCYSTCMVTGSENTGGLIGDNQDSSVSFSYWNTETSGLPVSDGGLGRTTDEMTDPHGANTYVDWNFAETWVTDTDYSGNEGYPYLNANAPIPPEGEPEGEIEGETEGELEGEIEGEIEGEEIGVAHPGDLNEDFRMVMGEAIAYLAGWQQGDNPMAYAIRAAYLWQNGEWYVYDESVDPPLCWVLAR